MLVIVSFLFLPNALPLSGHTGRLRHRAEMILNPTRSYPT
jgi:hypothetical protein